jgi:hypothetical protein
MSKKSPSLSEVINPWRIMKSMITGRVAQNETESKTLNGENLPTAQFGLKSLAFIRFITSSRERS